MVNLVLDSVFLFFFNNFIYLFLVVLDLCCCTGFSVVVESRGYFLAAVGGLLIMVAPLLQSTGARVHMDSAAAVLGLQSTGSIVVTRGLSCSMAHGIFLDQGSNLGLLH